MHGEDLNLNFNLECIYEDASFNINDFDKVGIVGVNGAGKTTLFKVLLKEQELDSGKITIKNKSIGYLPQEVVIEDKNQTVFEFLMSARPIEKLNKKLEQLYIDVATPSEKQNKILKEISKTQDLLEYYECYNAENILLDIVSNMHLEELIDFKIANLSGGQKSKVAFAHLLYSNKEILLLDEPTNHLDVETKSFVTNYLKNYKGMVLIISHDIDFLNQITTKTLLIDKSTHKITIYAGNYSEFMKKYEQQGELEKRLIEKQNKENQKLRDIVLLYSNSSGKRKRMAESREKQLNKNLKNQKQLNTKLKAVNLKIKPIQESGKIPLKVNNIHFAYENSKKIINNLSFVINNKERLLIVGENGVGKSTLLKLLIQKLTPSEGTIWYDNKTTVSYYAQELENLDLDKTILENMQKEDYSEKEIRTMLGGFLFTGDDVFKKVSVLSPGEKARLCMCKVMMARSNTILLDEPTNHLDPKTQSIIGKQFNSYEGTIILVSHNPSFVKEIGIDRMLILPEGKITNYSEEKLMYYYNLNQKDLSK